MPSASELISQGYTGYQGWGDPEAAADFAATRGAGKRPAIAGFNASKPAMPDFQTIYDTAVTTGTKDYQSQFDVLTQQLQQREQSQNEAIAKIADNPYLAEATMTGRIAKIKNQYNADAQSLVGKQTNLQNKIATAKADAQIKLNIAQNQYNIQSQEYQNQVSQINQYLSAGLFNNASGADIAQISTTTGMSPSMVQSIINVSKSKSEVKPQLMTVDDGTNQKILAVDANGKVINTEIIGESQAAITAKANVTGGGKSSTAQQKSDQQMQIRFEKAISDGIKQLQGGSQWGEVWNRIKTLFPDAPPELIDSLLGTSWRQPGAYQQYQATKKGL